MNGFQTSKHRYIHIKRSDIAYFKFLLEAHDNLGVMTVLDKYAAVLRVSFAAGCEEEMQDFFKGISQDIPVHEVRLP